MKRQNDRAFAHQRQTINAFATIHRCLVVVLLLIIGIAEFADAGELCPALIGEFECALNYGCVLGACTNTSLAEQEAPSDCAKIRCDPATSECFADGRCVPFEGRPCGRNVLIAENAARSISTDCSSRGKCVSGRCVIDKCHNKVCDERTELCRDGRCQRVLDTFCLSSFDCGPAFECTSNKCVRQQEFLIPVASGGYSRPRPRCDPGDVLREDRCVPMGNCTHLACEQPGQTCVQGECVRAVIDCGAMLKTTPGGENHAEISECPEGMVCRVGQCVADPCDGKCPPEHVCAGDGECRLVQGLLCADECPHPSFECVNGVCQKDECRRRVCQLGERCSDGFCIRVVGQACRVAAKHCGEQFACVDGRCADLVRALPPPPPSPASAAASAAR